MLSSSAIYFNTSPVWRQGKWYGRGFCCASSEGFGSQSARRSKMYSGMLRTDDKKSSIRQPELSTEPKAQVSSVQKSSRDDPYAPTVVDVFSGQQPKEPETVSFEERLAAIKRSAQEKKRLERERAYGPIDYDAPTTTNSKAISLPVKVGIGIGVVVFGLIFAFGDLIPSGEMNVQKANVVRMKERDDDKVLQLKEQLQGFQAVLKIHPDNLEALEGSAVTYAELGDVSKSETTLLQVLKRKPEDVEALRLLGEVQNALGKSTESEATYRQALKVSPRNIILWKGLAEALVAQGKSDKAVEEVIAERNRLSSMEKSATDNGAMGSDPNEATLMQMELLLGKIYAEWDHTSDAVAVYDSIIKRNPNDFRGYFAKGILVKGQGQKGEAERMFIQARYLAGDDMRALVDRYSKQ